MSLEERGRDINTLGDNIRANVNNLQVGNEAPAEVENEL